MKAVQSFSSGIEIQILIVLLS